MTDRKKVSLEIRRLERIKAWQLIVLLILMTFVSLILLRLNNIGMAERRSAVIAADESGDTTQIQERLYELQRYVTSHMNTDMGNGVYLQEQYSRDYQKALDKAASSSVPSQNIYKKVTDDCRARYSAWASYFQCVTEGLDASGPTKDVSKNVELPVAQTYRHVYASPLWSPDLAGWSLVLNAAILVMIVTRVISIVVLKAMIKRHYKTI